MFETFEEVLRLASTHKVDMVVLTGNLFHTATPSRRTFSRAVEALARHCLEIPVYAIHGDCDGGAIAANGGGAGGGEGARRELVLVPLTPGGVEDGRTEVRLPLHAATQISLGRHSREHPNPWGIRDPRVSRCHVPSRRSSACFSSSRRSQRSTTALSSALSAAPALS